MTANDSPIQYRRRDDQAVVAVRLDLDFNELRYQKWGGTQKAMPGHWLVLNQGDTYTVDNDVFARTYELVSPGLYRKIATIWAWQASEAGSVQTLEGSTNYLAGDYLVADEPHGSPTYAISQKTFNELYRPLDRPD